MKTLDGKEVKEGDTVYVFGSIGIHSAKVLPPVTSYNLFGPIEVNKSFSSYAEAELYRDNVWKSERNRNEHS